MKSSAVLSAFFGAAVAQNCLSVALTAIPSCAQSCFLTGAPSIGCSGTDFACQCDKEAALYAAIEGCVSSSCPEASYQPVIDGASSVCNCATGVVVATTTNAQGGTTIATITPTSVGNTVASYPTTLGAGATTNPAGAGATGTTSAKTTGASSGTSTGTAVPVVTAAASMPGVSFSLMLLIGAAAIL